MAIFRQGVKVGKYDIRTGVTKKRAQGFLRKQGIIDDDKGRGKYAKDAKGEIQTIRTVVGKGEGFQIPANFKVEFQHPRCINQESGSGHHSSGTNHSKVKTGGLDWQTHIMNKSTDTEFRKMWKAAQQSSAMLWTKSAEQKHMRDEQKMNLYCSKVAIPDKSFNPAANRQYNHPQFLPQNIQYGTLTTEFYCDGTMDIKNYFDAWQKLIYNDLTGNFNFYDEYVAEFDVFTRTTMASGQSIGSPKVDEGEHDTKGWANDLSENIKKGTAAFNDATGVDGPRGGDNETQMGENKIPKVDFRRNYGVRIFKCWPQIVSNIDLAHDGGGNIATFTVTWQYEKWNPFKMGNVGNRSTINLAIGEFRNEKDGFPFIEDLPPELAGPLTGAIGQGITTGPLSKASNLFG
jgi:hypothetical protein